MYCGRGISGAVGFGMGNSLTQTKLQPTKRSAIHLLDYIIVLRPTLLLPVWTLVLLGYYGALSDTSTYEGLRAVQLSFLPKFNILVRPNHELLGTLCLYSMLMGAIYIINQICDKETDAANNKLFLVAQGHVKIRLLVLEAGMLLVSAVVWAGFWFRNNLSYLVLIGLSILLGVVYSIRPVRLKGRPFLDLLANAAGYGGIAFLIGWGLAAPMNGEALRRIIPYALCVGAAFVNTTLPDLNGDNEFGDRTTGVMLGAKLSCLLSLVLLVGAILAAWWVKDMIPLFTALLCLPPFIYMNFRRERRVIIFAARAGILILSLIACVLAPFYIILLAGSLIFVRWYYSVRFGITYPGREA
ncbi:MAG: UbiA family prenyltransferase [Candidatus Poribacteria bacterium]|nr:UbiA family prenyltransferase [Candidatus Poribacteria bacterium]